MEKFLTENLQKGKYFTRPLYLDNKYVLLAPETPMTESLINRIAKWNFEYVFSRGEQVDGISPDLNIASPDVNINLDTEHRETTEISKAFKTYQTLVNKTEDLFADFINKNLLSVGAVTEIVKIAIDGIKEQRQYLLRLSEMTLDDKNYLVVHSVRTTLLAIPVGINFKMPNHKLIELGMTALLHEIGMIKLPSPLYMSNKILTLEERQSISTHVVLGFKILRGGNLPVPVCLAVLESHENIDGSGYPRRLTGDKVSLYAKIIAVASSFAALSSPRPFRRALDGHQSLVEVIKGIGRRYDDNVVRALVAVLSIFPIGTYVELAQHSIGMVMQTDEHNPKEPYVRLLVSPSGKKLSDPMVVKVNAGEYRIIRALTVQQTQELKNNYQL